MAFFGLKMGLDLETRAAHPDQKFEGVLSHPPPEVKMLKRTDDNEIMEH